MKTSTHTIQKATFTIDDVHKILKDVAPKAFQKPAAELILVQEKNGNITVTHESA